MFQTPFTSSRAYSSAYRTRRYQATTGITSSKESTSQRIVPLIVAEVLAAHAWFVPQVLEEILSATHLKEVPRFFYT